MRKFTQSIVGKGVTFNKLVKYRDAKGRVDFDRVEVDGIVIENDGYLCTVRSWEGVIYENVETSELTGWGFPLKPHDMPCLD